MTDNILVATLPKHSDKLRAFIPFEYTEAEKNNNIYFEIKDVLWIEDFNDKIDEFINVLISLNLAEWAFVRLGSQEDDIQIEGSPENFNISITTTVDY